MDRSGPIQYGSDVSWNRLSYGVRGTWCSRDVLGQSSQKSDHLCP